MLRKLLPLLFLFAPIAAAQNTFCASNLPCTITAPWTFTNTTALTGPTTTKNLNLIQFADQFPGATADVKITACLAALPTGGTCDARGFGATTQTLAATVTIGDPGATFSQTLLLDRLTTFIYTITNNTCVFNLSPGSGIEAFGGSVTQPTLPGGISAGSGSAVKGVICYRATNPAAKSGTYVKNMLISGIGTLATVSDAVISGQNILQPAMFDNVYIINFANTVGLKVYATSPSFVTDSVYYNGNIDGSGNAGFRPFWMGCAAESSLTSIACGGVGNVTFIAGTYTHPGTGGLPIFQCEASNGAGGSNVVGGLHMFGVHVESSHAADIGLLDDGCESINVDGMYVSSVVAGADVIKLTQTAGTSTDGVSIRGVSNQGGWTNTINNTITTFTMPYSTFTNTRVDYSYGPSKNVVFDTSRMEFVEGAARTAVAGVDVCYGDSAAHALECSYNNDTFSPVVRRTSVETLTNKTLNIPLTSGTGLQFFNTATSCTTAATISTPCTTAAITLPAAEADTNYRISCSGLTRTNFPQIIDYTKSNTTFTITLNNTTAAAATYASFDCSVGHN